MKTINISLNVIGYNKNKIFKNSDGQEIQYSNIVLDNECTLKCEPDVIDKILSGDTKDIIFNQKGKLVLKGSISGNYSRI